MNNKEQIIKKFSLSLDQSNKFDKYIYEINQYNKFINVVGKSTLINPWQSHILDCIQICKHIPNKKSSILDMGAGAGLPGLVLAIYNYSNVSLIDSNLKKINFVKLVCSKLNISSKIYHNRIEKLINMKFDYLVSRALSNLNKLFFYSHRLLKNGGALIFLKGFQVNDEINEAQKNWAFNHKLFTSISDERGKIIVVKNLKKIHD